MTDLSLLASLLPRSQRMPVLFVGHGSPMNVITANPWRQTWEQMGVRLLAHEHRPSLILCISAHWITHGWHVTAMASPRTIHDFGGFPQALFDQQYPAPGAPEQARAIAELLEQPGYGGPLGQDEDDWGLDHGAWSVLKPMFPAADIPVIQLSLDYQRPPAEHLALGRQLAQLRDHGVLIVGSGNIVHNLRTMRRDVPDDQAYDWALAFDQHVRDQISAGRQTDLADFQSLGEMARLAHPSWDHYLPLLHCAGAVGEGDAPQFFNEGFQAASISMRSVIWSE